MNTGISPILGKHLEAIHTAIEELPAMDTCWEELVQEQGVDTRLHPHVDLLIGQLPNLCDALGAILDDPIELPDNRMLASMAINYVIMPSDLIEDTQQLGRYGLMDDVLLVRDTYARLKADCTPELSVLLISTGTAFTAIVDKLPESLREKLRAMSSMCPQNAAIVLENK